MKAAPGSDVIALRYYNFAAARLDLRRDISFGWRVGAARLLFTQVDSWMTGVHSEVKHPRGHAVMVCAGGAPKFRQRCEEIAAAGYAGFELR